MLKLLLKKQFLEIFQVYFYDAKKNKARLLKLQQPCISYCSFYWFSDFLVESLHFLLRNYVCR